MQSSPVLIDIVGWIGAALLLLAYALVSYRRLAGDSVRFQLLNLSGGVLLAANSAYHGALPSVAVNAVWIAIGMAALLHARRQRV
jgi:hypothetical protein